jgi:hypothetical protein
MSFWKTIFSSGPLKSVNCPLRTNGNQRIIITFLWNEPTDAREIAREIRHGLQALSAKDTGTLRIVKVQIAAMWLGHQNSVDEIWTRSSHLDDCDGVILDISDGFCFKSACSIAERVLVTDSEVLWSCHDVFCFKSFEVPCVWHICWTTIDPESEIIMLTYIYICVCCRTWCLASHFDH